MKNLRLITLLSCGVITLTHAHATLNLDPSKPIAKMIPVISVNNNTSDVGTDSSTTLIPNNGLNTVPTKDIGTDTDSKQTEMERNFRGNAKPYPTAPAYAPPPRAFTPNTQ
ncbi:MAG: hypothetical protein WC785_01935 [Tatlockia sp.]|jgi:hypothetical protein